MFASVVPMDVGDAEFVDIAPKSVAELGTELAWTTDNKPAAVPKSEETYAVMVPPADWPVNLGVSL